MRRLCTRDLVIVRGKTLCGLADQFDSGDKGKWPQARHVPAAYTNASTETSSGFDLRKLMKVEVL
jgi:hypothetical protein